MAGGGRSARPWPTADRADSGGRWKKEGITMKYRILLSDIDGTLRPFEQPRVPQDNVEAIRAIQRD